MNFSLLKRALLLALLIICAQLASFAHGVEPAHHHDRQWKLKNNSTVDGSFLLFKNGEVFVEDAYEKISKISFDALSTADQQYVTAKYERIKKLNDFTFASTQKDVDASSNSSWKLIATMILLLIISGVIYFFSGKYKVHFSSALLFGGCVSVFFAFSPGKTDAPIIFSTSDPLAMDSAFAPFKPKIATSWDQNYFYVESLGIPDHQMMVGITSWQQQVPIPQCYIGSNAWQIPLNPIVAASPVAVDTNHFTRGAIAIAVNGVPIFNPYTNAGVDSYADGQLDNFGGHSGRADDYHYHIAPLSLYSQTTATLPIAFGFDGFAVYGSTEPDGTAMSALDANHGHYGSDGVYHYHGTTTFPYMIGKMVGQVTEDATKQIVPQPYATPVRPSLTPLGGALITDHQPNGSDGYILTYSLSGQSYQVDYNWTSTGQYTFDYISPTGTTTQTYSGFSPCLLTGTDNHISDYSFKIFPNPVIKELKIELKNGYSPKDIKELIIYDNNGKVIKSFNAYSGKINVEGFSKGIYVLKMFISGNWISGRFVVD
jgi:hypothetical protein